MKRKGVRISGDVQRQILRTYKARLSEELMNRPINEEKVMALKLKIMQMEKKLEARKKMSIFGGEYTS